MPKIFLDRSTITVKNVDLGAGTVINWLAADVFYNSISTSKTFSFSNVKEGLTVVVAIRNTGGSTITVTFPSGFKKNLDFADTVLAGRENIYTLIRSNGTTYITSALDVQ